MKSVLSNLMFMQKSWDMQNCKVEIAMNYRMNIRKLGIDPTMLKVYVDEGYITANRHPVHPLTIYRYTNKCVFDNKWNNYTKIARSLVLDDNGFIISRAFDKFGNNRNESMDEFGNVIPVDHQYYVTEKKDGSFIQVFLYNDEFVFTSSSTFTSEHAKMAEVMWNEHFENVGINKNYVKAILTDYTFLFEMIHPDYRIVIDYKDEKQLYLIGGRSLIDNRHLCLSHLEVISQLLNLPMMKVYFDRKWNDIIDEQKTSPYVNKEGYVVWFANDDYRVKVKLQSYFTAHKIVTNITDKVIIEDFIVKGMFDEMLPNLPDEFVTYVKDRINHFKNIAYSIKPIIDNFHLNHGQESRKDYAINAKAYCDGKYMYLLMNRYLDRDLDIYGFILSRLDLYKDFIPKANNY